MINELLFSITALFVGGSTAFAAQQGKEALFALVCLLPILANIFVLKQTILFGMVATCTDPLIIGSTLGLNLLQEFYGKKVARDAITSAFSILIFYTVITYLILLFPTAPNTNLGAIYEAIFSVMPRIAIASISAYGISQTIDYYIYRTMKERWNDNCRMVRNIISISTSQLIDTVIFTFGGLYGIIDHLFSMIIISYTIKLIAIGITVPITNLLAARFKKKP